MLNRSQVGWLVLFMIALFLIVVGFQGDLGLLVGIIFTPQEIVIGDAVNDTTTSTTGPTFGGK